MLSEVLETVQLAGVQAAKVVPTSHLSKGLAALLCALHLGAYLMPILMNQMGALTPDKDLASTPDRNGWSKSQEGSGAAMHLMHGVEDFVLGHTDQVHITAGRRHCTPRC
jgi:hypothetical protein